MTLHRSPIAALLVVGISLPCSARADEDPRKAQAEPVFAEGLKLHDAGREADALAKFEKAYAIYPSPNALFQIARSEHVLGRNVDAVRHYREASRSPLLHPKNVELARGFVAELEAKLARVTLSGPAGANCTLAGVALTLPEPEPLDVEPGDVSVRCAVRGASYEGHGLAQKGQVARIEVTASQSPSASTAIEPPPAIGDRGFWTTRRTVTGVVGGTLVAVSAAVGGVFLGSREGHVGDGKDVLARTPQPCAEASSGPCRAYDEARDGASRAELGAALSFGAAAALGAATAVLVLWPESRKEARVRVLPTGRELLVIGTF